MRHLIALLLLSALSGFSQNLKPGFDKQEYKELFIKYCGWSEDSTLTKGIPESKIWKSLYRSKEVGLLNRWELYENDAQQNAISIRGTVGDKVSWLANFYAAMIPAKGTLKLNDTLTFDYHFAESPRAAVHVGWTVAAGFLFPDILQKIKDQYKKGIKDFIIFGHSQGGAISYLLTAQLKYYQSIGKIPTDIQFKTYCSAAPKPGNLYFAYEYEAMTQTKWSFTVVNAADWVPEVPLSIQTFDDFNGTNPFKNAKKMIKKQPFPTNLVLNYAYNQLSKHNQKAVKRYHTYLGKYASKMVAKNLNGFNPPEYYHSNNYVRTGTFIVLMPDEAYYKSFPDSETNVFVHHLFYPYLHLIDKL